MIEFLKKYTSLFLICLPLWVVIGNIFPPLNLVFVPICLLVFYRAEKTDMMIFALILILTLGDSRQASLSFFKDLRVVALITIALISFFEISRAKYQINKLFLFILPFILFSFLSLANSTHFGMPELAMGALKTISFALIYFFALHFLPYHIGHIPTFLKDLVRYGNLVVIIGIVLYFVNPDLVIFKNSFRFSGIFGNPNGLGIWVILMIPIYVYYFDLVPGESRAFKIFSFGGLILMLLLSSSRNSLFSISLFLLLYSAFRASIYRMLFILLGIIPLVGLIIYGVSIDEIIKFFDLQVYFRLENLESGSGRVYAWAWARELIEKAPILGQGFYFEEYIFKREMPFHLVLTGHEGTTHNLYLGLLLNTGIVGFTLFFSFMGILISRIQNFRFGIAYLAMVLFSSFFESWLLASLNAYTIVFLIMISILLNPAIAQPKMIE